MDGSQLSPWRVECECTLHTTMYMYVQSLEPVKNVATELAVLQVYLVRRTRRGLEVTLIKGRVIHILSYNLP